MLFGGSGRPVPAARSSRLCPHAWGFADEWTLSGVTPAPLARGRGVCCLAGREDQFPPRSHRGYARMRGALPTNGRSLARNRSRLHEGACFVWVGRGGLGVCFYRSKETGSHHLDTGATPACVGALPTNDRSLARNRPHLHEGGLFRFWRAGRAGLGLFFLGAGKLPHTAWTPWLCPHAWGLCRRMDALRRAKGPAFMRAGRLDGTGRAARLSCPGEPSCRKFSSGLAAGGGCRNVVGNGALGGASACAPGSGACRQ